MSKLNTFFFFFEYLLSWSIGDRRVTPRKDDSIGDVIKWIY